MYNEKVTAEVALINAKPTALSRAQPLRSPLQRAPYFVILNDKAFKNHNRITRISVLKALSDEQFSQAAMDHHLQSPVLVAKRFLLKLSIPMHR